MFRIGQKVVCVDGSPAEQGILGPTPSTGAIYTVTHIGSGKSEKCKAVVTMIGCEELEDYEPGWRASRFRPVVERKTETGMAILREILDRETHRDRPPVKRTVHS